MFRKKVQKKKNLTVREACMALKGAANSFLQDFSKSATPTELLTLNALISYIDKFILNGMDGDKVVHKIWISARLLEVYVILKVSNTQEIKLIVKLIKSLQDLISVSGEELK